MQKTAIALNSVTDDHFCRNGFQQMHRKLWNGNRTITKLLLVVKLTTLLLVLSFLQVHAGSRAQTVTVTGKDLSIKQVFNLIEQQTGYVLFSNENILSNSKLITIDKRNVPLNEVLNFILVDQPLKYVIQGKTIILSRREKMDKETPAEAIEALSPGISIGGLVKAQDGSYLNAASIRVKGSNTGTMTNAKGEFQLKNIQQNDIIQISMMGYQTAEFAIVKTSEGVYDFKPADNRAAFVITNPGTTPSLILTMRTSMSQLDEIQIKPYGTTSRRLTTGNIGTIKGEDIQRQPAMTVFEALAGRVPGVIITPHQGNSAAPVSIQIRGRNSINPNAVTDPLYVIDGIPLTTLNTSFFSSGQPMSMGAVQAGFINILGENPLLSINPKDIESVDVLKDADATAIYGSRGANGVILITTKRGKPGPTRFEMSINNGIKSIQKYPKLLNTQEYLAMRREAFSNDGITPDQFNAPDLVLWDQTKYTDWQRLFGASGNMLSVDARLSGGMALTNYGISANYTSSTEIMNNGGKNQRASLNSFLKHTSQNQKLKVDLGNNISITNVEAFGSITSLGGLAPNAPDIYNQEGTAFNFEPYRGQWDSEFPFGSLKQPSSSNTITVRNNINFSYEILNGLTFSTSAGYNFSSNDNKNLTPAASIDSYYGGNSEAYFGNSTNKSFTLEPQLHYTRMIGKGNLSAQVIGSLQDVKTQGLTTLGMMFPNDNMMKSINNAGMKDIVEGYGEYRYISAAGILRYSWDDKYILNLNARRDASSRFGPGKQFGNFGSVGAAWIVSREKWMEAVMPAWFSFFKVRGSYGITGSDGIGDYEYLSRWANTYTLTSAQTIYTYNGVKAYAIARALNQDFQWEATKKAEIAAQLGFLDDKINVDVAYYSNISGNQLTRVPMPSYTGFSTVLANWPAKVRNAGVELSLNAKVINTKDWGLTINANISRNWNKLVSFPFLENTPYANRYAVGESLTTRYLLHYTGVDPINGTYTFEDHNKDGRIDAAGGNVPDPITTDRYVKLDDNPKYTGGLGINITYKRLSVHSMFSFVNRLAADPFLNLTAGQKGNIMLPKEIQENRWRKPGDVAKYAKYTTNSLSSINMSDAYYTNGSYCRMSALALTYFLPQKWIEQMKMKDVRIGITTQNLFTITSYKGFDPEIQSFAGLSPIPRVVTASLILNF